MSSMLRILSLGAGVQSSALLLMSIRGELPKIDHAIFADTQWEPKDVYDHLAWLESEAKSAGIPVHRVTRGNLRQDAIEFRQHRKSVDGKRYASIPLFVQNPDGSGGIIRRQCTSEYKIEPIERFIKRELLGIMPKQRAPRTPVVEQWFGITVDEVHRLRDSRDRWKTNAYPFCFPEQFGLPKTYTRQSCILWLESNFPGRKVPRSACIGCPYHGNDEWRRMRDDDPESWRDAVEFDREIRVADASGQSDRKILVGLPFLHRDLVPLDQVDLRTDKDKGQNSLWGQECEGMCGV
jgi:hypothetical protein